MGRGILLCIACVLGAAACLITYLATYESYDRLKNGESSTAIVREVSDEKVSYDIIGEDGQPIGPYRSTDVPDEARAQLRAGSEITVLRSTTDTELALALRPPSVLLVVGAAACLLLGVWFVVAPIRLRRAFARARGDFEQVVALTLQRARGQHIVIAIVGVVCAAFFGLVIVADPEVDVGAGVFIGLLAAASLGFSVVASRRAWSLRSVAESPLLRRLRDRPKELAWVYELVVQSGNVPGADYTTVMLHFTDGTSFSVLMGQVGVRDFLDVLTQRFPDAHFGYDREVERAYRSDPTALHARAR